MIEASAPLFVPDLSLNTVIRGGGTGWRSSHGDSTALSKLFGMLATIICYKTRECDRSYFVAFSPCFPKAVFMAVRTPFVILRNSCYMKIVGFAELDSVCSKSQPVDLWIRRRRGCREVLKWGGSSITWGQNGVLRQEGSSSLYGQHSFPMWNV
jgi:hypothetical protein